jgi:hypothetical protein
MPGDGVRAVQGYTPVETTILRRLAGAGWVSIEHTRGYANICEIRRKLASAESPQLRAVRIETAKGEGYVLTHGGEALRTLLAHGDPYGPDKRDVDSARGTSG